MTVFRRDVIIVFSELEGASFNEWIKATGLDPKAIPNLRAVADVEFDTGDFEPDEIIEAYEALPPAADTDLSAVTRAYRLMAEGDVAAAMDVLHRQFNLAPPSHEMRIADLLTGKRG